MEELTDRAKLEKVSDVIDNFFKEFEKDEDILDSILFYINDDIAMRLPFNDLFHAYRTGNFVN